MGKSLAVALVVLFSAVLTHAQDLDPRCSDRTAKGQFTCVIDKPGVDRHETVYPSVQFMPGDSVVIGAGGCVQTGGFGDTWKLYVNPSGPDSDHLYHGLIRIPTATPGSGLVRIQDVINQNLTVTGAGVPLPNLVLHLGYEDDDYSDNGYNEHDDGTEDQCRNVKEAQVRIVITRGAAPPPPPGRFAFNLEWNSAAPGGFTLNPQWAWQRRVENTGAIPDTALCHNFSKTVQVIAPSGDPEDVQVPDFADCTNQTVLDNVDQPDGFNAFACSFGHTNSFTGHLNWFVVTFEGKAQWGDTSTDDDYTFDFRRDGDPLSVNGRPGLHTEFDSEETIDNFNTFWWKLMKLAVDDSAPAAIYFDGQTILTGLYGLDCEHDCKGELHPLYAMATRLDNFSNSTNELWLMFVRNVGDEGFCSRFLWDAGFTSYTFRLPWRDGMKSVEVVWGEKDSRFEGTDGTSGPSISFLPGPGPEKGVYVTFKLPPASQGPLIDGALRLKWTGKPLVIGGTGTSGTAGVRSKVDAGTMSARSTVTATNASEEIDEAEHRIRAAIEQLPQANRQIVVKARTGVSARVVLRPLPPGGAAKKITSAPVTPLILIRNGKKAGIAAQKQARDAAQMRALCAATHNAPAGLPPESCKAATVRDHR